MGEGAHHALAFVLVLVTPARGEHEERRAVVPVDADPHLLPEPGRIPRVALLLHATSGTRIVLPGRPRGRHPPVAPLRSSEQRHASVKARLGFGA